MMRIGLIASLAGYCLLAGCVTAATKTAGAAVSLGASAAKAGVGVAADAATMPLDDKPHEKSQKKNDDPRPFDASRNAMRDVDVALAAAQISGKNTLLVFGANWCHDSRGLAAKFERSELAQIIADHYELVWVDVGYSDRNLDVLKRFGVKRIYGTPVVLILSPESEVLNADSVHDWRAADSISYEETVAYFGRFTNQPRES